MCFALLIGYQPVPGVRPVVAVIPLMLLFGIGFAAARPALTSALTKAVDDTRAGSIMGVAQSLDSLATVAGPLLSGWLWDWRGLGALGATAMAFSALALGAALLGRR
jgi:predicted MFS family arabinose efflux permease